MKENDSEPRFDLIAAIDTQFDAISNAVDMYCNLKPADLSVLLALGEEEIRRLTDESAELRRLYKRRRDEGGQKNDPQYRVLDMIEKRPGERYEPKPLEDLFVTVDEAVRRSDERINLEYARQEALTQLLKFWRTHGKAPNEEEKVGMEREHREAMKHELIAKLSNDSSRLIWIDEHLVRGNDSSWSERYQDLKATCDDLGLKVPYENSTSFENSVRQWQKRQRSNN